MTESAPTGSPCPKCGQENPETVQFCTRCHAPLRYACPACHHLQPHSRRCDACGVDFVEYETKQSRLAREQAQAAAGPRGRRATLPAIAGVAVLLAIGAWGGVRLWSGAPTRPKASPPVAVAAPAPPPAPSGAPEERQLAAGALRSLQGLRALGQGRVNYMEYAPRAFEAKQTVDRYVREPGGDAELKRGARETMDLYMLAATAWNAGLRADSGDEQGAATAFAAISRDPALDSCPAARAARDDAREDPRAPLEVVQGMHVVRVLPAIFACAESRLADVERRLAER